MSTKKQKKITDKEVIALVEKGAFADSYLVYGRRSTDDTDTQKNSLTYQKSENVRFARKEHLKIAKITLQGFSRDGIISERHSAFTEKPKLVFGDNNTVQYEIDRPKFYQLATWLNKRYFKGVIFLCWDRASRNKGDEKILRTFLNMGVDIRFVLARYEKTSAGELHMDIDGMFSVHHSRVTSEKVSLTIKESRGKGLVTYRAPVGYLNKGSMDSKPFDPIRAPIIREMFDKAATGEWSLADIARWANEQGFTMAPMRRRRTQAERLAEEEDDVRLEIEKVCRPITPNGVHKILTNRFYTGKTRGNIGEWVLSISHDAIASDEVFERVQHQLQKKNKSVHYTKVLEHPLRGIVNCTICKRVYTPYPKKGIMYYGARCRKDCPNPRKSFNIDFITEKIGHIGPNRT